MENVSIAVWERNQFVVQDFVEEVLRVYRDQFWFFVKLVTPAIVVGYIAVLMGRNEGREIARQLLRVHISDL